MPDQPDQFYLVVDLWGSISVLLFHSNDLGKLADFLQLLRGQTNDFNVLVLKGSTVPLLVQKAYSVILGDQTHEGVASVTPLNELPIVDTSGRAASDLIEDLFGICDEEDDEEDEDFDEEDDY